MKIKYKIYCDLDSVLTDFDSRFKQFSGMLPHEYEPKYELQMFWEIIDKEGHHFWSKMEWMCDGRQLWEYISIHNPSLLSSPSSKRSSRHGKRLWVNENIPGTKLILSKRENKKRYSGKNSILIDDRTDNISDWVNAGGIGILHTSTSNTINELKKLGL